MSRTTVPQRRARGTGVTRRYGIRFLDIFQRFAEATVVDVEEWRPRRSDYIAQYRPECGAHGFCAHLGVSLTIVVHRSRLTEECVMRNSFPAGWFGTGNIDGVWQAVEDFRSRFEKRSGSRVGRGEVRAAVLALLAERPMHGYQIIHEIEERSGGGWKPSAGSVYPTLQLLADEGLITAEETNGRKIYSLTEAGREEAPGADASPPWESAGPVSGIGFATLPKAGVELAQVVAQVGRTGSQKQVQEAVTVLDEARRRLYLILAQD